MKSCLKIFKVKTNNEKLRIAIRVNISSRIGTKNQRLNILSGSDLIKSFALESNLSAKQLPKSCVHLKTVSRFPSLGTVLMEYLERRKNLRPRTRTLYKAIVKQRLWDWWDTPLTEITRDMVERKHHEISTVNGLWKASKVQANLAMRVLRLLFNFARNNCSFVKRQAVLNNPVETLTANRLWHHIPPRQGVISDTKLADWYHAVCQHGNSTLRDFLLLVLLTGLRRREALDLRWSDIDFATRVLRIDGSRTKNHQEHRLPLPPFLMKMLEKNYHSRDSEYVFQGRVGAIHQSLVRLRNQSGCHFTIHDLRRTFLTVAERLGTSHYALKRLANHAIGTDTTFGYIVIDVERLRRPMEQISNQLLALMKVHSCDSNKARLQS